MMRINDEKYVNSCYTGNSFHTLLIFVRNRHLHVIN